MGEEPTLGVLMDDLRISNRRHAEGDPWRSRRDPRTGYRYWANVETREAQWGDPYPRPKAREHTAHRRM